MGLVLRFILLLATLALPGFEHDVFRLNAQNFLHRSDGLFTPRGHLRLIDGGRSLKFRHLHPFAVNIDGEGIFRQVAIIQAIALDILLSCPFPQHAQVLAQAIA